MSSTALVVLVTVEAVAILLLGLLVAGLLRSHAEILRSLHELGAGRSPDGNESTSTPVAPPAPATALRSPSATGAFDVVGTTPGGDAVSIGVVGSEQATLLAFLSSGCLTCTAFWDAFSTSSRLAVPGHARLVVVTKDPDEESPSKLRSLTAPDQAVVMSTQAWTDYEVPVAPYFILVDGQSGRVVGEGAGTNWQQVSSLLAQALEDAGVVSLDRRGDVERRRERARAHDAAREAKVDEQLMAAGVHPGHPSLYPERQPPSE